MNTAMRNSDDKESRDQCAAALAETQLGLIALVQALDVGFTRSMVQRRVESGRWRVVFRGIYAISGFPATWLQTVKAATMLLDGVASHSCAASMWAIPGITRRIVEVSVTSTRRTSASLVRAHRVDRLDPCDVTSLNGIPVTTPARTLLDLAGILEEELLEQALDHCLHQGLTSLPPLRWTLQRLGKRGRHGTRVVRELLGAKPQGYVPTQSVLETRAARRILRALEYEGLPPPVRQYVIKDRGRFVAQVDFAYPHAKVAIEAQSVKHHAGRQAWERDSRRFADLASIGWRAMPVLWDDTEANLKVAIERIRRAIEDPKLFD
jgi:very-short-patch-repair endonuclease